jgi:hypothetical protein
MSSKKFPQRRARKEITTPENAFLTQAEVEAEFKISKVDVFGRWIVCGCGRSCRMLKLPRAARHSSLIGSLELVELDTVFLDAALGLGAKAHGLSVVGSAK